METNLLEGLDFVFNYPTPYTYLYIFMRVFNDIASQHYDVVCDPTICIILLIIIKHISFSVFQEL